MVDRGDTAGGSILSNTGRRGISSDKRNVIQNEPTEHCRETNTVLFTIMTSVR